MTPDKVRKVEKCITALEDSFHKATDGWLAIEGIASLAHDRGTIEEAQAILISCLMRLRRRINIATGKEVP